MADPKKISPPSSKIELEKWLQQQLDAAGGTVSAPQPGEPSNDDPFYKDAMEGLKKFDSTSDIYKHTSRINRSLQKKTGAGKKKNLLAAGHLFWFLIAIVVVIMVIILAFVVIRMRMGQI